MAEGSRDLLRQRYLNFARFEAHGISPLYEDITTCVSNHEGVITFLETLPVEKQQPNLLLAAFRQHCGIAANGSAFCDELLANGNNIRDTMLLRSTQTNEPARCATLLPVLSRLPQPLALLEVGASAGLCLFPDRYAYQYGSRVLAPAAATSRTPRFCCAASADTPRPAALPEVVWRAGIDINPLDVRSDDDVAWLENLVWPEQVERRNNLRLAIEVMAKEPPLKLVQGDLNERLEELVAAAPAGSTVVVFHTAVLAYVQPEAKRREFAERVLSLNVTWIANEHPLVFGDMNRDVLPQIPPDRFLLSVNGKPMASTGPHGQSLDWLQLPG